MNMFLKTIALAAAIGSGSAALPAAAQADSLYFSIGQNGPEFGLVSEHNRDRDWREHRRGDRDRWERRAERREGRSCTPGRALDKAERLGLRRAFVRDVGRRTIEVSGRQRGDRVTVTFARAPGCPVLDW